MVDLTGSPTLVLVAGNTLGNFETDCCKRLSIKGNSVSIGLLAVLFCMDM